MRSLYNTEKDTKMNLANFIQEYLNQQGQELSDEQKLALELVEQQYPNQSWTLKKAAE
jgi:hypothetical protein